MVACATEVDRCILTESRPPGAAVGTSGTPIARLASLKCEISSCKCLACSLYRAPYEGRVCSIHMAATTASKACKVAQLEGVQINRMNLSG